MKIFFLILILGSGFAATAQPLVLPGGLIFIDAEVPSGNLDGLNSRFVLNKVPSPAESLTVHRNGIYLRRYEDYTIQDRNLLFLPAAVPQPGDLLVCSYRSTLLMIKSAGDGQFASNGKAFSSTLQVTIQDGNQNPVPGAIVTFSAPPAGPGGTFTGGSGTATAITDQSGVAVSPAFTANYLQGSYNVMAAQGGFAPVSFSLTNAGTNLAVSKNAIQSSTYFGSGGSALSAVDGNTDGNWSDGSVTHTKLETNPWWQVDLGGLATINFIVVWNRTDCCGDRLSDYWVFVSNTPFVSSETPASLQTRAGTWSHHEVAAPNPFTALALFGAQGRYVRVQLSGTNYLSLAEVQVMGSLP